MEFQKKRRKNGRFRGKDAETSDANDKPIPGGAGKRGKKAMESKERR